jgi:hypothetical protein
VNAHDREFGAVIGAVALTVEHHLAMSRGRGLYTPPNEQAPFVQTLEAQSLFAAHFAPRVQSGAQVGDVH